MPPALPGHGSTRFPAAGREHSAISYFRPGRVVDVMLLRLALGLLGLVEVLWPRRTVDFWMDLATDGGEAVELRPWVYTAARVEGVLILLWVFGTAGRGRSRES